MFSISQQIDEVKRELKQREHVYARLVATGKMRQSVADYQTQRMQAVLETLEGVQAMGGVLSPPRNDLSIGARASLTDAPTAR